MSAYEASLGRSDLAATWHEQLTSWLVAARDAGLTEPTAMVLATADGGGAPSARTVLLKHHDERGLVFYTNLDSRKGAEIAANPRAAAVFPWFALGRQVLVAGAVEEVDAQSADRYFARRRYGSQIGAHASRQSSVIPDRATLEAAAAEMRKRHPEGTPVPRPERWGGLRIVPESVEFWQGREDRLHDRLRFRLGADGWVLERLSP